ncbi:MAG: biotin synthase BioB [Candidatus Glassbacteria bacterium]|nr:biotin synthase BioB [Candidatus Glassbacteria bacterium]
MNSDSGRSSRLMELEAVYASDGRLGRDEALAVLGDSDIPLSGLLALADRVRRDHRGDRIRLCSIINARSGVCGEDCTFCAQSARWSTGVETYPLMDPEKLAQAARRAGEAGAGEFSIVTSGAGVKTEKELAGLESAVKKISADGAVQSCASLGRIEKRDLQRLVDAGLQCFHHNLETSREFFPEICSTHSYDERLEMVRGAKKLGLRVCSGGIFGLGESDSDRVALALELRELGVDSIPLNFLHPIAGTPLENADNLTPETCLRIIAAFRLLLPERDIVVCGGRVHNLGELHPLVFWAGANGILTGDYLTTTGRSTADDLTMLKTLGLKPHED